MSSYLKSSVTSCRIVWSAVSLMGRGVSRQEIDRGIIFVRALGAGGETSFCRELEIIHGEAEESGLLRRLEMLWNEKELREPTPVELRRCVQAIACMGQRRLISALKDPSRINSVQTLDVTLEEALAHAPKSADGAGALAAYISDPREVPPLRRDGSPWLAIRLGIGVGVRIGVDWPFRGPGFGAALADAAAAAALSASWIELRAAKKNLEIEVVVEYWIDPSLAQEPSVRWDTSRRLRVFMVRKIPVMGQDSGERRVGEDEAARILAYAKGQVDKFLSSE